MKKFLNKLKNITANFFVGALIGWFAFAISFDIVAIIMFAFFPNAWSEVVYHMNQFLGF